ncbi:MAG: ABC transporter permease [Candidatus Paraimprobicoccus trichonymphae]|uniref:ABC transporter permease n=1 Tax=Candidatus Paraimprobicoccus trichonymphae TaxID=3033793 RepID=A0AA48KXK1_9FIRM|nr:MAG: ABC transporter permease [Candidatus Paraimprobicoccus trichonymphae]
MGIILSACSQGLIWAVMALGLYITFRILDFADMTVDGTITLGGSVSAVSIYAGINPFLSLIISVIAGMLAGLTTGILHTKLKIQAILSGILVMIALYSVNIRIMGKANISLLNKNTIFNFIRNLDNTNAVLIFGFITCIILILLLYWFFGTELGAALRATGNNSSMASSLGINTDFMKILGLVISNGLCAFSGALISQNQGYSDINTGTGAVVIGLASIVIGEAIFKAKNKNFYLKLISVALGSIFYRIVIAFILELGLNPSDLKLITAVIVSVALVMPNFKKSKISQ